MCRHRFFCCSWILALILAACGPVLQIRDTPQPSPAAAGEWTVKLTQSGGFAGVMLTVQVSSDGTLVAENKRAGSSVSRSLPPEITSQLARYYPRLLQVTPAAPQSACADCFLYRLDFSSLEGRGRIEADDTTLAASGAEDIIRLLQRLREDALKGTS